jgi:hypothetical protein
MHLDRKHLTCIEELQQQRKSGESTSQLSHQWHRTLLHFTDGAPFERPVGNMARMILAVTQYPRFADGAIARQRRGE